jgi:signal transduction histidine kinase
VTQPFPQLTRFLPAERAPREVLERQIGLFAGSPLLAEMLDASPDLLLVLNPERQIVFANERVLDLTGVADRRQLYGQRPGEALGCIHADVATGGCGTTDFCTTCGAARAIRDGLAGKTTKEDCRILRGTGPEALDLRAWARPLILGADRFIIFSLTDSSNEQRRHALERIFFHDLLNTAGALRGLLEELSESQSQPPEELALVHQLADELIDEIQAQRILLSAERGDLAVESAPMQLAELLERLVDQYRRHPLSRARHLRLDLPPGPTALEIDATLLRRCAGNLLKNAIEATDPGQTITVGCSPAPDGLELRVHNPGVMPPTVQLQVFHRSFSTKGPGRGLGTYSVLLLGERYLQGRVSFTSTPEAGTTFRLWLPLALKS